MPKRFYEKNKFRDNCRDEGGYFCPNCNEPTFKLVIFKEGVKGSYIGCRAEGCGEDKVSFCYNRDGLGPNLHKNVGTSGVKVTVGKAWEIDNRTLVTEGGKQRAINKVTGLPAQR